MRPTVAEKKPGWAAISRQVAKNVVNGAQTATQMMDLLGMKVSGDIAKTITQLTSPPLKPATIRNRLRKRANQHTVGSLDKPLVDSGIMLGTLSHDVEDI
ncbi:hypothetical protein LPW36_01975 [Jinshanibacter sp. LJY008]|uniref:Uncharacterized protein n=1 Tax=Limnobaculum eriocheiris TaxID=2897391 RepID=A0A9X1MW45_9GAMM|nr:hypothetical protein [Limnobaculum eriocheiris]MCD1124812.1 hypothetical protein [Limnobaculum eriocheiris]